MPLDAPNFERTLDDELAGFLIDKLAQARHVKESLEQAKSSIELDLAKADRYVIDCERRLASLGLNPSLKPEKTSSQNKPDVNPPLFGDYKKPLVKPDDSAYDPTWSYLDKIRYVLRNPSKYGFPLFKGAGSVVKAIFKEEPNFRPDEKAAIIQVAPQVSRVVKVGDAVKVPSPYNKTDFYFVSAEWFDEKGQIKTPYEAVMKELNLPLSR
ncbi:hypothetical protein Q5H92_11550 [Hymenobacter sp. M29]|uniref:Uncharacterized protein n=1 Tax=Hymenobacter mellowenesis TaxID=3063995 RepID=A0ABT9ACU4_9BACT|nr:hypothetical protein [Hymenobacter sp. M29]MDO7846995.1 hypothetical protein [Hymenobacter sp. M29]